MKRISTFAVLGFILFHAIGCGGATSAARVEGPVTASWTQADDEALGIEAEGDAGTPGAR